MAAATSYLELKVGPKASRDAILGWYGTALKVTVTAAPERGRANAAVASLIADALDLPSSAVEVVGGLTNSRKRIAITGLDEPELHRRLTAILDSR